jgi:CRP/FNR family transcriptional regulator, cyclic AMP receptor protein
MDDIESLTSRLKKVEHFRDMPADEVREFILSGHILPYAKGQVIFVEDNPNAGLYVLLSGQAQICRLSPQGQISIMTVLEPVHMFNEVAALDEGPNPATAIATLDSLIWNAPSGNLRQLILKYPEVGIGMLHTLAARNRALSQQFYDLSFRSVLARTAKMLVMLSNEGKELIDRRKNPNHQMAARISTVPEAFSRALKVFREAGDILCSDKIIEVKKPSRLLEVAHVGPA